MPNRLRVADVFFIPEAARYSSALIKRQASGTPSSGLEPYWFLAAVPICPKLGARRPQVGGSADRYGTATDHKSTKARAPKDRKHDGAARR
jgi:hypothetical protein